MCQHVGAVRRYWLDGMLTRELINSVHYYVDRDLRYNYKSSDIPQKLTSRSYTGLNLLRFGNLQIFK